MSEEVQVTRKEEPVVPERMETRAVFEPQVDIIEKADSVVVLADMPGVPPQNVEAVLEKGVLRIHGRVEVPQMGDLRLRSQEYEIGDFRRAFTVGEGLSSEGIQATMKDGVLRLVIPKSEEHKPHRIEVKGQ
jgi:HSP20 family molecular chaperone IbpA